ncbi:protein phosphatase 1K, mitochondrial-like [Scleropages formosus]|uniref:Protein phosphatase 1K, mitochondrial-like n=1 Tax=Scleropages formosus TaxID=113540 RepID=A0A0P7UIL7_SCLFO|nr:protein phosphatase 1K, mitochondrial-like [Scleropages formosus]
MSTAALLSVVRVGGLHLRRRALLNVHPLWDSSLLLLSTSPARISNSRFDPDGSGRPTTWDTFGIWDNRIDEPILLPSSIRYGTPIPKVSLSNVGSASQIGQRKENEDRFRICPLTDNILYFAVFDGHGGPQAADYCHKHMEKGIRDTVAVEQNLELVLTKAFLEIDKALESHLNVSGNASLLNAGTTATVALLRDGIELVVGSVGDSRALLIKRSGGFVTWNSVGQANVNGRLAMTRSIGDFDLKSKGVIAEPETKRITLQHAHDSFLALTTDGINFIMNSQEICDIISQCSDPKEATQVISEQALQYGTEDNSTIIIVPFGAWGKHKASSTSYSFSRSFVSSGRWA